MRIRHHDGLEEARRWRADPTPAELRRAEELLRDLWTEFPYAQAVGDELALVLEKLDRMDDVVQLLREMDRRFHELDEETLCRWGKVFKKKAVRAEADPARVGQALRDFEEAERYYARAYDVFGGFYPRINELTVRFLRAALARPTRQHFADGLLEDVRRKADQMLQDPEIWVARKEDDHVWIPATHGEAQFLRGRWAQAAAGYREAMREARGQPFYHLVMCEQVKRLAAAAARLELKPDEPFDDPDAFFAVPTPDPGATP